jgi:Na+/H+ antiporter NhaD/arsenite permease-like protein
MITPTKPMPSLRIALLLAVILPGTASAHDGTTGFTGACIGPVPIEFILFGIVLAGVAAFHLHTLRIALVGAIGIALYKIIASPFGTGGGVGGFGLHLAHEWVILINLLLLLVGFVLLARHFEASQLPAVLPRFLPDGWLGCFALLALVFVLSSFLDNIAAAMIGGAIAHTVFKGKVHIAYLAGIVAASNAGGAASVIGDTTTTMMWIAGIAPLEVAHAAAGSIVALLIFGVPASLTQERYSPIQQHASPDARVDWMRVGTVCAILGAAIGMNVLINTRFSELADSFPFLGAAVWGALLLTAGLRKPEWRLVPNALKSSAFLLSLVLIASMMPVERLPAASWLSALGLGFASAVFDNIPLTALALKQGGYDWGVLAYAVGFGGSMIWFGSSAGVALSSMYPDTRYAGRWLRQAWYVPVAYVAGFFVVVLLLGFNPGTAPRNSQASAARPPAAEAVVIIPAQAATVSLTDTSAGPRR